PVLDTINNYLLPGTDASAFRGWVRTNFQPMIAKVGWTPSANENADTHTLRGDLVHLLGMVGEDPETIPQATTMAGPYLNAQNTVDASVAKRRLNGPARYGDETLCERYVAAMRNMSSPEQYYNVGGALAEFRGPKIVERVLQLGISDEVRSQDSARLI